MMSIKYLRLAACLLSMFTVVKASAKRKLEEEGSQETSGDVENTSPVVIGNCDSTDEESARMVELTPELIFHWTLVEDASPPTLDGVLEYEGEGWLGFGVSPDGGMVGSKAIIGLPDSNADPQVYDLSGKAVASVTLAESSNLERSAITQAGGKTILRFVMALSESNSQGGVTESGLNTFIYAIGASNALEYHQHRGSFRIDLQTCESSDQTTTMTKQGAFAAHGTLAVLAWGIASPFAATVAWFRTLVPSSWIYIHVFANVWSFIFTVTAVIVAITAMSGQENASHFSHPHHIIGVIMMVLITFQVMNGFMRPPVEKRDPYAVRNAENEPYFKVPKTPREIWYFLHRLTGVGMLAMGVYQIVSGLTLYADDFNVTSIVPWFWLYFGVFVFFLLALKGWIMLEEYRARQSMTDQMDCPSSAGSGSSYDMEHYNEEMLPAPVQFTP